MKAQVSLICPVCQNNIDLWQLDTKYPENTIILSWDDLQCVGTFLKSHYVEMRQLKMHIIEEKEGKE